MDYTFSFKRSADANPVFYWGSDTLDKLSPAYDALDCGNDLIDKFKAYYELGYKKKIPRPLLFVIDSLEVNAFAVYEKKLNQYCIGINYGAFQRIKEKVGEIVDMVIEKSTGVPQEDQLIPANERDKWVDFVYINAMRFFVAHEYAHILNGHVDKEDEGHFEFADELFSEEKNLFQQMKEFDADETAMNILCYMTRNSFESGYRMQSDWINKALSENNQRLKQAGIPEILINMEAKRYVDGICQAFNVKVANIRRHFKYLMLSVNVVFLVLDERRAKKLGSIADKQGIPQEDRTRFYFTSGLQLIRAVDHPIPALRLDAVTRIMDENIEGFEGLEKADEICKEVADYVWEVEFLRCDYDVSKLYVHIAHTPTAQDFIQEVEILWQREKNKFQPYIDQLERLFYKNRIVDMSDDGDIIAQGHENKNKNP